MSNLDWDSVRCKDPGCPNDHLRYVNRDTGEIINYVHGPDDLGAFHLCSGVGLPVADYVNSTSAMEAAQVKYLGFVEDAEQKRKLKEFAVANLGKAVLIDSNAQHVGIPLVRTTPVSGPPEGY